LGSAGGAVGRGGLGRGRHTDRRIEDSIYY
jgi:hypothetical protein